MEFIKVKELKTINGGYLANSKDEPVTHDQFIREQQQAHYVVSLATNLKGKDFVGTKPENIDNVISAFATEFNKVEAVQYVTSPTEPKMKLKEGLADEAMKWLKFQKEEVEATEVNKSMQAFNTIKTFEDVGLYFNKGLSKLSSDRIYTIEEILEASTAINKVLKSAK